MSAKEILENQARRFLEIAEAAVEENVKLDAAAFNKRVHDAVEAMTADVSNSTLLNEIKLGAQNYILECLQVPNHDQVHHANEVEVLENNPLSETGFVQLIWAHLTAEKAANEPKLHEILNQLTAHDSVCLEQMLQCVKQAKREELAAIPSDFGHHLAKWVKVLVAGALVLAAAAVVVGTPTLLALIHPGTAGFVTSAAQAVGLGNAASAVAAAIAAVPPTMATFAIGAGAEVVGLYGGYKAFGWMRGAHAAQHNDVTQHKSQKEAIQTTLNQIDTLAKCTDHEQHMKNTRKSFGAKKA